MCRPVMKDDKKSSSSSSNLIMLPEDYAPESSDILCGRGNVFSNHEGNRFFERLVRDNLRRYAESKSRPQKIKVVDDILRTIRISGARFAKIDSATKRWCELNDVQAHQKIGHAIRDTIRLNGKHAAAKKQAAAKGKGGAQSLAAIHQRARTVRRQQQADEQKQLGRRSSLESILSSSLDADDFFAVQRELGHIRRLSSSNFGRGNEHVSKYRYPTSLDSVVEQLDDELNAVMRSSSAESAVSDADSERSTAAVPMTITTSAAEVAKPRRFLLENEFPEQNFDFSASHFFEDAFSGFRITSQ